MNIVEALRALVRPLLALSAWAVILYQVLSGDNIPGELWAIASILTGFYFAERAVKK